MSTYLILVAMDIERDAILSLFKFKKLSSKCTWSNDVYSTKINNSEILVACSGVGITNAALTTAFIAKKKKLDGVISLGVAGALLPQLLIGDLVVCEKVIQHDCIRSFDEGIELMKPGSLHLSLSKEQRPDPIYSCSQELTELFKPQKCLLKYGTIISGNEFVGSKSKKIELASKYDAFVVDMESAGVAQVTQALNLPLAVFKTIADSIHENLSSESLYKDFKEIASSNASQVVKYFLEKQL